MQAIGLGMELSVILAGFACTSARVFHADNAPAGAATAKTVAAQLSAGVHHGRSIYATHSQSHVSTRPF